MSTIVLPGGRGGKILDFFFRQRDNNSRKTTGRSLFCFSSAFSMIGWIFLTDWLDFRRTASKKSAVKKIFQILSKKFFKFWNYFLILSKIFKFYQKHFKILKLCWNFLIKKIFFSMFNKNFAKIRWNFSFRFVFRKIFLILFSDFDFLRFPGLSFPIPKIPFVFEILFFLNWLIFEQKVHFY